TGSSRQVTVTQVDDVYPCPFCSAVFKTKGGCRKHLTNLTCAPEEQDNDEPGQRLPVTAMPSQQSFPVPVTADPTPQLREYNDAVLYSCNQTHVSDAEKQRTLAIVNALELRPFAIKDADGAEQNGLAHASIIAKLSAGQGQVATNMPLQKKIEIKAIMSITILVPFVIQLKHLD
ncbi:hypothetical protein BGZ98_008981, partial [Dissophora globulifera]